MSNKREISVKTVSPTFLLFLLFLGLKLTGYIDWSWWWVTAPLWIPFGIIAAFFAVVGTGFGIVLLVAFIWSLIDKKH